MSTRPFSVRIDIVNDSLEFLDNIASIANQCNGSFKGCESVFYDYSFINKKDASQFTKEIKSNYKDRLLSIKIIKKDNLKTDKSVMKTFKSLPENIPERIASLTPSKVLSSFDTKISILNNGDCLVEDKNGMKFTYIIMRCKVTGKKRGLKFYLQSGSKAIKKFADAMENNAEIKKALKSGWSTSDISYDAFIKGVFPAQLNKIYQDNNLYHEVFLSCNTIQFVVHDYLGEQHIGWFFYNDNLDETITYANFNV